MKKVKQVILSLLVLCSLCSSFVFPFASADEAAMPEPGMPEGMDFGGWNEQAWQALQENGVITEEILNAVTEYFTEKFSSFVPEGDGTEPPEKPDGEQGRENMTPPDGFQPGQPGQAPEMNGDMPQGQNGQAPGMKGGMEGGQPGQGEQPPEKPDGEQNMQNMTPPEGFSGNGDGTEPPEMPEGSEYMGITAEILDELLEYSVITQEIYDAVAAVIPEMTAPLQA